MSINLGDTVLKKFTTGRLYWQPTGQTGYIDFGNVTDYKDEPKVERVPHMQSKKGFRRLDFALIKTVGSKKTFTLDEHFNEVIKLLMLGMQLATTTQLSLTADADDVTADDGVDTVDEIPQKILAAIVAGRVYDLGYQGVQNLVVTDSTLAVRVAGTDYDLHPGDGMFTVKVATNAPWTLTFGCAKVTDLNFSTFSSLLATGSFKFMEFDQFSEVPRNMETFSGQVYVTAWGENKTDGFNEFTIEVLHQNSTRTQRA